MRNVVITKLEKTSEKITLKDVFLSPLPREISFLPDMMKIGLKTCMVTSEGDDSYLLRHLNAELRERLDLDISSCTNTDVPEDARKVIENVKMDHDEGYLLEMVGNSVIIVAKTSAGLFYGLQLLYQLLFVKDGQAFIPSVRVRDWPKMAIRGISHDISRGQSPSLEAMKRHIRLLSRFRMNTYQLYIEDMFAFKKYPQIGKDRGALTPAMIKEIEEYAKEYHVEVMPIFQNLSHMENMLVDPEIGKYAEYPGAGSLNLAHPDLYAFLTDLLGEIAPAFSSKKFHVGCDESWDVGMYGAKKLIEQKGMARALLDHYLWVMNELKKHGKTTFFLYHDIAAKYDEVLAGLPKDGSICMVFWEYSIREDWPEIDRIASFGVPFVVSSSVLSWTKPFPEITRSFESNRKLISNGLKKGAIGQINSSWGDYGEENFHENNLMQFCYSSAFSWNDEGFADDIFVKAYSIAMFGITHENFDALHAALSRIHGEFPPTFITKWLGFLWRHPYHSKTLDNSHYDEDDRMEISPNLVYKEDEMEAQRPLCREIVKLATDLKPLVRRNATSLGYLEFAGRVLEYFINKFQTTAKVTNICLGGLDQSKNENISTLIKPLIAQLKELRGIYERLWLHCASRPNLDRILQFYDWQIFWQESKLAQISANISWVEPYIDSEWIWLEEPSRTQQPRYFKKEFSIETEKFDHLSDAFLQLAPGNHGILWINGKLVGSGHCGYQSSVVVLDNNIRFWNVKDFLEPGTNVIAVQGTCFFLGNPVINVYGEIFFDDGSVEKIISDRSWKVTEKVGDGWQEANKNNEDWKDVASKGKPPKFMGEISLPRFKEGLKSKHTHRGYCRILRAKAREESSDFLEDITFFNGEIL